jgi:hypothetical protein
MTFLAITLITRLPDHATGVRKSTTDRFREVVDNAVLAGTTSSAGTRCCTCRPTRIPGSASRAGCLDLAVGGNLDGGVPVSTR